MKLSEDQLKSFETGVKYQMYHAIILILIGIIFPFMKYSQIIMAWCFLIGILLFSFSIYGLILSSAKGKKLSFLGPVTPMGGLLLVVGWVLLTYNLSRWALYLQKYCFLRASCFSHCLRYLSAKTAIISNCRIWYNIIGSRKRPILALPPNMIFAITEPCTSEFLFQRILQQQYPAC